MRQYREFALRRMDERIAALALIGLLVIFSLVMSYLYTWALNTSNFTQTINAGTLTADIVDAGYSPVGSPSVAMGAETFDFSCQAATGTFGTATEQLYVQNPDAADGGWTLTVGAVTTAVWDSAGTDYDFNDPTTGGCEDGGGDADSLGGQMTVDPSGGSLDVGACSSCTTSNISLGSSDAFEEGVTDSITLLSAASGSDDIGDWTLQGVDISQQIPGEQPAAADYDIDMTITATVI